MRWLYFGIILLSNVTWASGSSVKGGIMDPNPGMAIWTVLIFIVLLAVLKKLAWGPMLKALDEREKGIREDIENAEKSREQAQKDMDEARKKLDESAKEARAILETAQQKASEIQKETLEQTQNECNRMKKQAEQQVENAKEKAIEQLWATMAAVSTEIAGKLLNRTLDQKDHSQIIAETVEDMRQKMEAS